MCQAGQGRQVHDLLRTPTGEQARTEDDAVELVGAGVCVGQQDAAGLEHRQELRLPGLRECGQEGVGALGHALLQHRRIVRHRRDVLHTHSTRQ